MKVSGTPLVLFLLMCLSGTLSLFATPAYAASWARQASSSASVDASKAEPEEAQPDSEPDSGDDVYRHSASVKWLGSWLHLGKESSARLFEYLNFAILAGAVLFALLKYLPQTFRENRAKIQHQLVDARTATEQAHERLAAIEQRLGRLDEEIAAISKQAEKDSLEDEARIKASIEAERKRIVDGVTKDIAAAGSAAQRDLKRFAAGLAVDRAAQGVYLTEADDHALMQEFAQSLGHQGGARGKLMAVFAARYARALAGAVLDAKLDTAEVQQQLDDFAVTFAGSKDLRELLLNPSIPVRKRVSILDTVNRRVGCGPLVRNFLAVLISHERLAALSEIFEEYRLEMNRRLSISDAEVVTARPLGDDERAKLEAQVAELAGTRVSATFREDKSVIGGAIVRIGSTIYDGSVRGRLERLRERLVSS